MRYVQTSLSVNQDMTADFTSIGIDLNQTILFSIQAVYTGSPAGTIQLQVSNDNVPVGTSANKIVAADPAANVVNWTVLPDSDVTISAAGSNMWNIPDAGYRWVRVQFTAGSSTGTANIEYSGKSI